MRRHDALIIARAARRATIEFMSKERYLHDHKITKADIAIATQFQRDLDDLAMMFKEKVASDD